MAILLSKWDTLVSTTLYPSHNNLNLLSDISIQMIIYQSEIEREKVRTFLIEGIIDKPKIKDKQQFVQLNQAMLIRLLDKIYSYKQNPIVDNKAISLYNTLSHHLESTLNFIEDFFSNFFDRNERVPAGYLMITSEELCKQLEYIQNSLKENNAIETDLISVLVDNFNQFCTQEKTGLTYNELVYQKELMSELLTDDTLASELSIREVLFYFNFNDDGYVAFLYGKLNALTEPLPSRREKIAALRFEQKNMNQLRTKLNNYLSANMPSLKEQVNQWIEEEVKFLEIDSTPDLPSKKENEPDDKIHTSLSVAKLALLIRLMVIDKTITNRVVANVLRIAIRTVTTLQREEIAFGSLETKYHNPDKGTISGVKDILFRWINILNKL